MLVTVAVVSTACQFVQLPDGGYWLQPDNPSGARVLIIGDSLIRQPSLSVAFSTMNGGVETLIEAVNTSGLISGPTHWQERAAELIASFHPTIVLIHFLGNFTAPYWAPYAPPGVPGSPEYEQWIVAQMGSKDWVDRYVSAGKSLTGLFQIAGVRVYWVEPPPLPPSFASPSLGEIIYARWKAELPVAFSDVRMLSARASVATPSGGWLRSKAICGSTYEIRSYEWDGGVHFTADGAGTYGRALARALSTAEGWPAPPLQCPGLPD